MNYRYSRNRQKIYMILEGRPSEGGLEERMLKKQQLSCLLPFHLVDQNEQRQVWYDVSGKRALKDYIEQEGSLDLALLRRILLGLAQAYGELERYLISEQSIYLSAESLYLDLHQGNGKISLCYCPIDIPEGEGGLLSVFEYLLLVLDHGDERLRRTCYNLYEMLAAGSYRIQDLLEQIPVEEAEDRGEERAEEKLLPGDRRVGGDGEDGFSVEGSDEGRIRRHCSLPKRQTERSGLQESPPSQGDAVTRLFQQHLEESDELIPLELLEPQSPLKGLLHRLRLGFESAVKRKKGLAKRLGEKASVLIPPAREEIPVHFDEDRLESDETVLLEPGRRGKQESEKEPCCARGFFEYQGRGGLESFQMQGLTCHIGSGLDNQIILKRQGISRMHAVLYRKRDGVYLEDLSSLNGTVCRIQGEEVWLAPHQEHRLSAGEEVSFAGEPFVFR